jgi:hypothetical protein
LVAAVLEGWGYSAQHGGEACLAFDEAQAGQILAVEEQQIEQEEYQCIGIAGVGRRLELFQRGGDVRKFKGLIETGSGRPAPIRGIGSSSRTRYTPSTISTFCEAHQRVTNALASVTSAK